MLLMGRIHSYRNHWCSRYSVFYFSSSLLSWGRLIKSRTPSKCALCRTPQTRTDPRQAMKRSRWRFLCHIIVLSIPVYLFGISLLLLIFGAFLVLRQTMLFLIRTS
ncbi:hypothetical protein BDR07DRAFT_1421473 [Suillus spraguei]|nr:hypothetical protein BDR07DRAFT_1421473 [Suillus spraguei]